MIRIYIQIKTDLNVFEMNIADIEKDISLDVDD